MHLMPQQPHPVAIVSHFDYVAADAQRRRIYAAHTGSDALLVVNADTGAVISQVDIGPLHGVAVDPKTGTVYTGDESGTVSAVDPTTLQVTNSIALGRPVDAIAFDPQRDRVYADEDSGNHLFVVDAAAMKLVATVITPGDDHEYLDVDPHTGDLYQNIPDLAEYVVVDPTSLRIIKTVKTPELKSDHPLQFDAADSTVVIGGKNGLVSVYDLAGKRVGMTSMPSDVDQCSLDQNSQLLACAASGTISLLSVKGGTPKLLATTHVGDDAHTIAIDAKTGALWTVLVAPHGDLVQRIDIAP